MVSRAPIRLLPLFILLIFSGAALVLWRLGETAIAVHTGQHVDHDLARIERALHQQMVDHRALLKASAGLLASNPAIDQYGWELFHQQLAESEASHGLRQITYYTFAPALPPGSPGTQTRADRSPPVTSSDAPLIFGALTRNLSETIDHREGYPPLPLPSATIVADDPLIKADLTRALQRHSVVLTQSTTLFPSALGTVSPYALVMPVYKDGVNLDTLPHRLAALRGVLIGVIDLGAVAQDAVVPAPQNVGIAIADLGRVTGDHLAPDITSPLCSMNPDIAPLTVLDEKGMHDSFATRLTVPGVKIPLASTIPWTMIWSSETIADHNNADNFLGAAESLDTALQCRHIRISLHVTDTAYHQASSRSDNIIRSLGCLVIAFLISGLTWLLMRRTDQVAANTQNLSTALSASEERYKQLFRKRKAAELIIDPNDGRIVDANDAAVQFYGWSHDALCAMFISEINVLPQSLVQEEMQKAALERRNHFYFRHRLADGSIRDVEVYSGAIVGLHLETRDGEPSTINGPDHAPATPPEKRRYLYSTIHDITDRKQAERALSESEAQFRVLFESSPLPIQIIDAQGRTVRVNAAWEHLWEQSSAAAIHKGHSLLEDPQMVQNGVVNDLKRALSGELIEMAPFHYRIPSSERALWLRAYAYPLERSEIASGMDEDFTFCEQSGPLDQVIIIYQDVTNLLMQEEKLHHTLEVLKRSNAELEQFAYVASHDLQEPLRMVTSYLTLLRKRLGEDLKGENREFLDFAVEGARRMQDLIRDLLEYARTGHFIEDANAIESHLAVEQAQAELGEAITSSNAQITVGALPAVAVDASELSRLFTNLIGNAIKYRKPTQAPEISITCEQINTTYRFSVCDNGIGIANEYQERIFKIFQRLHTSGQSSGTGIGLAICRKIVEHNGGEIGVTSTPGEGSCFWFTLPMPGNDGK